MSIKSVLTILMTQTVHHVRPAGQTHLINHFITLIGAILICVSLTASASAQPDELPFPSPPFLKSSAGVDVGSKSIDVIKSVLRDNHIFIDDWGAHGTLDFDDSDIFQAAADRLAKIGGVIFLGPHRKYKISRMRIPENVVISGMLGTFGDRSVVEDPSGIYLSPQGTIEMAEHSELRNIALYRQGFIGPARDEREFSGTAVTITGSDARLSMVAIIGFEVGVVSSGNKRIKLSELFVDAKSCIRLSDSYDTSALTYVRCWPYASAAYYSQDVPSTVESLWRSGVGVRLSGANDDTEMDHVLVDSHGVDFWISSSSVKIGTVWGDYETSSGHSAPAGTVGFLFDGNADGVSISNMTAFSMDIGVKIEQNLSYTVSIATAQIQNTVHDAVRVISGNIMCPAIQMVAINGYAFNVSNQSSYVYARGVQRGSNSQRKIVNSSLSNFANVDVIIHLDRSK